MGVEHFLDNSDNFSALCHGTACSAWIEENTIDPEIIDCGWPTIRFFKQNKSIDEAVNELFKLGDKLRASADTRKTEDSIDAKVFLMKKNHS